MSNLIRVLELRCADGPGGGPEKTILLGAARSAPDRYAITVCYLRHQNDEDGSIRRRAEEWGVDYVEVRQRHPLDHTALRSLCRLIRERQIDIIHAHDYKTDLLALLLARSEAVIPVATAHGWTGHSVRERRLYYPVDKTLLARYPLVIAVSDEVRSELISRGARPDRVEIVVNGIDHRRFRRVPGRAGLARARFGIAPGERVLASVGRLEPQKRFDLLLQSFALLRNRHPELRLLIAGEGSQRGDLSAEAERLGLGNSVRLLGHCEDVVDFYHAIDIFAQSSDYEGTPNVVLEAMALEVPVVATRVGGTGQLLDHGVQGLLVPPGRPDQLAEAISEALNETSETACRVASARRRVETELSFDVRQERLEALYEQLLRRGEMKTTLPVSRES